MGDHDLKEGQTLKNHQCFMRATEQIWNPHWTATPYRPVAFAALAAETFTRGSSSTARLLPKS